MLGDESGIASDGSPNLRGVIGYRCCAQFGFFDTFDDEFDNISTGEAFDVIIFRTSENKLIQNNDFLVKWNNVGDGRGSSSSNRVVLEIRRGESRIWLPIERLYRNRSLGENMWNDDTSHFSYSDETQPCTCCRPNMSERLSSFPPGSAVENSPASRDGDECEVSGALADFLLAGRNPVRYLLLGKRDRTKVVGVANANIFLWSHTDRFIVSDIDGTITKSNVLGVVDTLLTENYQHCHEGVCQLLTTLSERAYARVIYVTSRPIALASATRRFLENMSQNLARLPHGPLLGFGGGFPQLLTMELLTKTTHQFKAGVLLNQVVQPYRRACMSSSPGSESSEFPMFMAGFGNTYMDVQAYHVAGIHLKKIFLINRHSSISVFDKASWSRQDGVFNKKEQHVTDADYPRSRKWYEERTGTTFFGYADERLIHHAMERTPQGSRASQHIASQM